VWSFFADREQRQRKTEPCLVSGLHVFIADAYRLPDDPLLPPDFEPPPFEPLPLFEPPLEPCPDLSLLSSFLSGILPNPLNKYYDQRSQFHYFHESSLRVFPSIHKI